MIESNSGASADQLKATARKGSASGAVQRRKQNNHSRWSVVATFSNALVRVVDSTGPTQREEIVVFVIRIDQLIRQPSPVAAAPQWQPGKSDGVTAVRN